VLWCSYSLVIPYRRKANIIKLYGKMLTSEIDIQPVKLNFTKNILLLEFKKTLPFTVNTAVFVFHF